MLHHSILRIATKTLHVASLALAVILAAGVCGRCLAQLGNPVERGSANTAKSPATRDEITTNTIGMRLKWIPAGSFEMGSPNSEKDRDSDEGPVQRVTLSKGFYLGVCEVTQAEWQKVMGNNPSDRKGMRLPVNNVSWNEARDFCRKISEREKTTYRLPTEAEWEYACRAGTKTAFFWGATFDGRYAWTSENCTESAKDVGTRQPNPWGLYDMSGNVSEWCEDWYKEGYPSAAERTDPKGPTSGETRVLRGGSANVYPSSCRSANRPSGMLPPDAHSPAVGFRIVRDRD